ncbi:MAG: adenylate/guanylate cyclase domain-containing protein [Burkholderiales bacterium]
MATPEPKKIETVAILFADISGSTALYETLGDELARELVTRCLGVLMRSLPKYGGELIKTIGDEILCVFPSAQAAVLASSEMQVNVENDKPGGKTQMFVRIGFHYGEVIRENNDVFGDAVNVAARITSVSRARQILATHAAVEALPLELRSVTRQIRRAAVKGKQEAMDIFEVTWQKDDKDVTRVSMPVRIRPATQPTRLVLSHLGQQCQVNPLNPSALLGRGNACQVIVADDFASRQHAKVELRDGQFILSDLSINGTYVRFADGHVLHAVQGEIMLRGAGSISLGRAFFEPAVKLIEFDIPAPPAS